MFFFLRPIALTQKNQFRTAVGTSRGKASAALARRRPAATKAPAPTKSAIVVNGID